MVREKAKAALTAACLPVHEEVTECDGVESLGIDFRGEGAFPLKKRCWRLVQAVEYVRSLKRIQGEHLEVLLRHFTHIFLLSRPALSVFHSCYAFMRKHYTSTAFLWKSVDAELRAACGLLPLIGTRFNMEWSDRVVCSDACLEGFAVHESVWPLDRVIACGVTSERWRFKTDPHGSARFSALEEWCQVLARRHPVHAFTPQEVLENSALGAAPCSVSPSGPQSPDCWIKPPILLPGQDAVVAPNRVSHGWPPVAGSSSELLDLQNEIEFP